MLRGAFVLLAGLLVACRPGKPNTETDDSGSSSESGDTDTGTEDFDPNVCGGWNLDPEDPPDDPGPSGSDVVFTDVTEQAGLTYRQYFRASSSRRECIFDHTDDVGMVTQNADCEPTWFTGGAAAADYDADGWPDLYVTRLGAPDILWHNTGDGEFEDRTDQAGLADCRFTNGANWADLDNDGDQDLLVSSLGAERHYLFLNRGDGTFDEAAVERGLDLPVDGYHSGQSFGIGDYDLDGELDVHVNEWLRTTHYPASGAYGPRLLHNVGDAHFEDLTADAGVLMDGISMKGMFGFSSTFVDLDGDRYPDLAVAADFRSSRMFWNDGDGTFTDGTMDANLNRESNAMGSTFGDYDADGLLDWYVTSIAEIDKETCDGPVGCEDWKGTGNRLYRNEGNRTFTETSTAVGVRNGDWAWGTSFFDFDNDGDQDIVLVNGWPGRDLNGEFFHHETPVYLWRNEADGTMTEIGAEVGLTNRGQGRALVPFDYDGDGDLDLFIANHAGRPVLYRNDGGNDNDWLYVLAIGTTSNRDGRGAVVTVTPELGGPSQVQHVGARSHFLGEGELMAHFGLGPDAPAELAEVRIYWPATDQEQVWADVDKNQLLPLVEP
jgi:hypothetical protein